VLWVAVTLGQGPVSGDLAGLLTFFPGAVELPPLRHHIEDLHELVPFFLARLNPHGPPACSPEAMRLLLRSNWPGNTEQLGQVLRRVVQRRRSGIIYPGDLPPECWSVSRRLLSPLESIERDAIVQSLLDHEGNKARGAASLGMSRATIYRKIHEYGILTPAADRRAARTGILVNSGVPWGARPSAALPQAARASSFMNRASAAPARSA
jgi:sigma-54 dependent transcriptional regulator, acetoin dehydrogenase operon transcriptional activator AcoR